MAYAHAYAVVVNSNDGFFMDAHIYGPAQKGVAESEAKRLGGFAVPIEGDASGPWVAFRAAFGYGPPSLEVHGFVSQLSAYEYALDVLRAGDPVDTVAVRKLEALPA